MISLKIDPLLAREVLIHSMLINEVNNMRSLVLQAITNLVEKQHMMFVF
jgi:hypothetical protein